VTTNSQTCPDCGHDWWHHRYTPVGYRCIVKFGPGSVVEVCNCKHTPPEPEIVSRR